MSEQSDRIAEIAVEMRSMAQTGLCYDTDDYQRMRYNRYLELSNELESIISGIPQEEIASSFNLLQEYATPKLDVRGVVERFFFRARNATDAGLYPAVGVM